MKALPWAAVLMALSAVQPPTAWADPNLKSRPNEVRTGAPSLYAHVPEAITDEDLRRLNRNAKGKAAPFTLVPSCLPLVAAFRGPPDKPDFRAEVRALRAQFQKAEQAYLRLVREAPSDGERRKIERDPEANPVQAYLEKFKKLADRARGTEGGAYALVEVLRLAQRAANSRAAGDAVRRLVKEHVESPAMERLANLLGSEPGSLNNKARRGALESIRDGATLPKPKAAALYALAVESMAREEAASRAALNRLAREFAKTQYATMAERSLFELDHLQVGQAAPDFEATDELGAHVKLSDFLGTVTVVDFWGSWSEPCRRGLPQLKALVERLEGRAFAILGVNSDFKGDLHRIYGMMREEGVMWRQAIDGSKTGPIATLWNVRTWPTTYVLDAKGVIRFKSVRGEKLGRVVNELLAEMGVKKEF